MIPLMNQITFLEWIRQADLPLTFSTALYEEYRHRAIRDETLWRETWEAMEERQARLTMITAILRGDTTAAERFPENA